MTQAGGKLSNELIEYFAKNAKLRDVNFYVMYGQTEATARMSYLPCQYTIEKIGSIGQAIPGGKFEIWTDMVIVEESNIIGELVYKGKNVSLGYAECFNDLLRGDDNKGTLYTGDLVYKDNDGFYYIAGRKKRFLKLFGNIDVACVGTDDKMIIYTTDLEQKDNIINFLVVTLKLNRIVFETRYLKNIPRSETGKVLYAELPIK